MKALLRATASSILLLSACAHHDAHVITSGEWNGPPPAVHSPVHFAATGPTTTTTTTTSTSSTSSTTVKPAQGAAPVSVGTVNGWPCGGQLPPCWVLTRESGGNPAAYNPGGCNGHGCYGPWQFSGAWAGRLGLPTNLRFATAAQWNTAAVLLWDGGRGCSNWDACTG